MPNGQIQPQKAAPAAKVARSRPVISTRLDGCVLGTNSPVEIMRHRDSTPPKGQSASIDAAAAVSSKRLWRSEAKMMKPRKAVCTSRRATCVRERGR